MKHMVRGFVCLAIAAGMSFAALAESYTWKGGPSANFEDAANWDPEGTPGAGDSCTISKPESGATAVTVNTALNIAALIVGGGDGAGTVTLTFANGVTTNKVSGDVDVLAGGKLTHKQQSTTANSEADALYKLILHVGGGMTINGGSVNVDYCGYNTGRGPGGPGVGAEGGGAYGGIAWNNSKTTYGSIRNPTDLGSGGAGNRGGVRKGGGAVILDVTGTLSVVNGGLICARGESSNGGGGGEGASGGSVNLRVGQLAGTGSILADNDIYDASNYNGAGGRVAVVQRTATDWSSYTGTMRAKGGQKGGPGTVYKQLPGDPYGDVTISNNGWSYAVRTEISQLVTDRDEPFGSITVKDSVTLKLRSGVMLKVVRALNTTGGSLTVEDVTAGVEFVGAGDATWTGAGKGGAIGRLVCTVPGKRIYFGNDATKDKVSIRAGGELTLWGTEENPLSLLPADGTKTWNISAADGAKVDIGGVAVSNSVAAAGKVLTASGSVDLGGNDDHWKFIPAVHPGDRITWTGAVSANIIDEGNWNPERSVVNTDDVHIPAGTPNALVLTADQSFNKLTVEDGATLTVDGAAITVTNALTVGGTLAFTGNPANRLSLAGAATFAANSLEAGKSTVEISGATPQTIHLGGNAFDTLAVVKGGGQMLSDSFTVRNLVCSSSVAATLSFDSDFTAEVFDCEPSAALSLVFPAGRTATISRWILQGADADNQVSLVSSAPGTQWLLNLQDADPTFAFVTVTDSDARPGRKVVCREGATVTDGHNNLNWAFGVVSYSWTGDAGDGDFHNAANWSAGADPFRPDFVAEIPNPASGALTISVTNALDIADLAVGGGEGAGTVKLDFANGLTTNRVSGNVMVRTGATLTHTANSNAAKYKLNLAVGGNLTVESGASVSADKAGFASNGPGADGYGGAGVYGGKGKGSNVSSYGSIREPTDLGSQGGGGGRVGGGAIMLDVDGVLTVNGTVSACGWIAAGGSGGNGGSGGSVFLKVGTLAGSSSGIIKADHSAENFDVNYTGSGGRIAIHQRTATDWSSFAGSIHAYAGKDFLNKGDQGGAGTVFMKLPGQSHGDLIVKGGSCAHFGYCITDLSARITDLAEPFDTVTVAESSTLLIREGITLRIAQGLDTTGGQVRCADTTATVELVGDDDFTWRGGKDTTQLRSLVCTIPGKKLYFATGANDVLTLPDDIQCVLHGDETAPLYLLPLEPTEKWKIKLGAETKEDFAYVAVSNSDATVGLKGVKAVSSVDLGGNDKWAFIEPIVPGEEIVWTGLSALDPTDWTDADNWNRHRAVEETDAVRIPAGASHYPTIGAGNFILNKVTVEDGGSLQLTGSHLTITNEFNVHGALVCTGTERFDVSAASVDFTGGSVTPAASDFILNGETDQTVNLGDCTFNYVNVERSGAVSFTGGFSAKHFSARPSAALALTFAADETVTVDMLVLQGFAGGEKLLTLGSSVPGTAWKLKLAKDVQQVAGVRVSDSDASGGVTIRGGSTTTGSNTTNWDFDTDTASWTGGAGTTDFATAGNWTPAVVPGADTVVDLTPLRGETVTVVVPANSPVSVRRLMLGSGEGTVKFMAQSPITVREKLEIPANATVALNCFDTPNVVSDDVVIRSGGVLTHDRLKKLNLVVMGDLTIEDGGAVDVNEKGYYREDGSKIYVPSLFEPTDFGECGDGSKYSGGVVKLEVAGTLTVDGAIDACGTGGGASGWSGGGGSIWLTVGTLAGSGRLRAHPCKNPNYSAYDGNWCQPGGRIAVYQRVATNWDAFSGTMNADGGKRQDGKTCTSPAGTIYLETAADQPRCGEVIIRSDHTFADERTSWPLAGDGDVESSDVYAGVKLTLDGGNLTVTNTAWTEAHTLKISDIDIQGSNSKAYLNGSTLKVSQLTHRNGRDWEGWTKSDKPAAYAKHVVEDGGAILWPTPGMLLMIR